MELRSIEVTYEEDGVSIPLEIEMEVVWHGGTPECDDLSIQSNGANVPWSMTLRRWDGARFGAKDQEAFNKFIDKSVDEYIETASRD